MIVPEFREHYRDVLRTAAKEAPREILDALRRRIRGERRLRVFVLNSGSCGSGYITELMRVNGVRRAYHEKWPDFDDEGVRYYLEGQHAETLCWLLRHTRRLVEFEANNRLFAFAPLLKRAFPDARFIHLHRDPRGDLVSAVNKDDWPTVMTRARRLRYTSALSGPPGLDAVERSCHYWNNINRRIADDLEALGETVLSLKFSDLVAGRVDALEDFLGLPLAIRQIPPVNAKQHLKTRQRDAGNLRGLTGEELAGCLRICAATMRRLGYREDENIA